MYAKCLVTVLLATTAVCVHSAAVDGAEARAADSGPSSIMGDLRYLYKVYHECAATDLTSCLKLKLVSALDRAARSYNDLAFGGIAFVKDKNAPAPGSPQTEGEIEATLPRSLNERDSALNNLITEKVAGFFDSHSLQVKLPSASEIQRSFSEEGRGKKKKLGGLFMIPLVLGGTLIPLALGALALLAGKALIVAKLALVLAGIIGLKKLLGGGHHHESGHEVVVANSGHGSGWGRSYEQEQQAQRLAYNAYAPNTSR